MPPPRNESDAEVRSRERREEARQQQELLNSIRDDNSIFDDGQMEGDNAKDWMETHPGDAFQNIVKVLKEIDNRSGLFVDSLGELESEQKDMNKKLSKLLKDIAEKGTIKKSKKKTKKKSKKKSKKKKKSTKRKGSKKRR